jgi:hypothetical protein
LCLNLEKKSTEQLRLLVDTTNYESLITKIDQTSSYNMNANIVNVDLFKFYRGLRGHHKDYILYFNYELTSEELNYIKSDNNRKTLATSINDNIERSGEHNSNSVLNYKLKNTFLNFNKKYINITFRYVNNKDLLVYVNNYLYFQGEVGNNPLLNKIVFYGNI